MMQFVTEFVQKSWSYLVGIAISVLSFSTIFFMYAKYKTGKNFKELLQIYFDLILKSIILTVFVFGTVFVLIHYVPMFHIIIFLLTASSVSIVSKYTLFRFYKKVMIFDIAIVIANTYCSYVLMMQERLDIHHYLFISVIVFCFILYQQIKKIF